MITLIALVKRKQGLSKGEFRRHYEENHAPLALKHLGSYMKEYRRSYPTHDAAFAFNEYEGPTGSQPVDGTLDYDCITTIRCQDLATLEKMNEKMMSPGVKDEIVRDEARFMNRSSVRIFITEDCSSPRPVRLA